MSDPVQGGKRPSPRPVADRKDATGAGVFSSLALELHDSLGVEETVDAVVQFALAAVGCSHAGIALAVRGKPPEVPAATDPVLVEIYRFQLDGHSGPMVESLRLQRTVLVRDTATDQRWPEWAKKVRELGVRTVLDVPLNTAAGAVGVLGLYSTEPDAFDADDEAVADILARHASVAVATARNDESLMRAVDARKLVGEAQGILMERFQLDADQAFAVLRRYSQETNTKLREVAQQLIDTRKLPF